jgi:hypothetical protein
MLPSYDKMRFRASPDVVVRSSICHPTAGIKTTAIPVYLRQLTVNFLSIYDIKDKSRELIIEGICGSDIKPRKI